MMEDGLYYFAATADYGNEHFQNMIAKTKGPPMVFFLNQYKYENIETVATIQSILETIPRLQRMLLGRQLWLAAESSARTQI